MIRSPLKRKTVLRSHYPLKRTPLRQKSPGGTPEYRRARSQAFRAAGGRCQVGAEGCTAVATQAHHRRYRSQGGEDTPENLLPVCAACHQWIHDHPKASARHGFTVRRGDQ